MLEHRAKPAGAAASGVPGVTARMGVLKFWLSAVIVDLVCNSTQMFKF